MCGFFRSLFKPPAAPTPAPPPPPVVEKTAPAQEEAQAVVQEQESAPEVTEAKTELRQSELKRKGRRAAILTSGRGVEDALGRGTSIARPRAAALLGG